MPKQPRLKWPPLAATALLFALCRGAESAPASSASPGSQRLVLVADVPLPGRAVRFDYQDIDAANRRLFIAHMNDASVDVVRTVDGKLVKVIGNIPTPRGVAVAESAKRVFVTSSPGKLVIIDSESLSEVGRVATGKGPDGVAWDFVHDVVGVSDQGDGALSLIAASGAGSRRQVSLGRETGNVVFDPERALFWITVVADSGPDLLSSVEPRSAQVVTKIPLPGCSGAHGLRIHPGGKSALVACEGNSKVARVDLDGSHALSLAASGADPDVLAIDAGLGWLYVAAERGDLRIFDLTKPGLVSIGREHPGNASHSVAVDPSTHQVFFPLAVGPRGSPVLRIMRPAGTP
jgi:DNA-binding beta-propeller fold protein YncE